MCIEVGATINAALCAFRQSGAAGCSEEELQALSTRVLTTDHRPLISPPTHQPSPPSLQGGCPTPTVEEVLAAQLESDTIGIPRYE